MRTTLQGYESAEVFPHLRFGSRATLLSVSATLGDKHSNAAWQQV